MQYYWCVTGSDQNTKITYSGNKLSIGQLSQKPITDTNNYSDIEKDENGGEEGMYRKIWSIMSSGYYGSLPQQPTKL